MDYQRLKAGKVAFLVRGLEHVRSVSFDVFVRRWILIVNLPMEGHPPLNVERVRRHMSGIPVKSQISFAVSNERPLRLPVFGVQRDAVPPDRKAKPILIIMTPHP